MASLSLSLYSSLCMSPFLRRLLPAELSRAWISSSPRSCPTPHRLGPPVSPANSPIITITISTIITITIITIITITIIIFINIHTTITITVQPFLDPLLGDGDYCSRYFESWSNRTHRYRACSDALERRESNRSSLGESCDFYCLAMAVGFDTRYVMA